MTRRIPGGHLPPYRPDQTKPLPVFTHRPLTTTKEQP